MRVLIKASRERRSKIHAYRCSRLVHDQQRSRGGALLRVFHNPAQKMDEELEVFKQLLAHSTCAELTA